ncbi:MAG TPA: hypothetical protein VHT68_09860 [Pseudolabrys sp.]|jgi:hypothetical protein|nr:hypothetical protein [Pseudolabrys sp.]
MQRFKSARFRQAVSQHARGVHKTAAVTAQLFRFDRYFLSPRIVVLKEILACSDWSRTALRRCRRYAITSRRAKADIGDGGKGPKPTG